MQVQVGKDIRGSWCRRKREKRSFVMVFSPWLQQTEEESCPLGYPSWQEHPERLNSSHTSKQKTKKFKKPWRPTHLWIHQCIGEHPGCFNLKSLYMVMYKVEAKWDLNSRNRLLLLLCFKAQQCFFSFCLSFAVLLPS